MRHDSHYVDQIVAKSRSVGRTISIESTYPNPEQPRTEFGDLTELTESIREKGVLEPLLVKPTDDGRFMIIAGERRWRSSKLAGLTEVPCIEMDLDDQGVAEIALIENLQRKDLNIWEEADGLAALASKFGYTQEEISKKISKSRSTVTELMTVAGLPDDIRVRCRDANIASKSTLLEIARQFDDAAMHEFLDGLQSGKVLPKTKQRTEVTATAKSTETRASNGHG
jgi:ParB family chromosome partitioning protein